MENVTQKRTPGEWRELFSSQEFEEAYEYGGDDLGAVYQTQGTDFALWAPTAERAELLLYRAGSAEEGAAEPFDRTEAVRTEKGVFRVHKSGDLSGVYYTWLVTADGQTRETADPYAKAAGVNGQRSMVIDLKKLSRRLGQRSGEAAKGSGTRCLGSACRRFFPRSPKRCFGRKSREI